jgi:hypothetical protein
MKKLKKHGIIIENLSKFDIKSIYNNGYLLRRYTYPSLEYSFSNTMVNDDNQHFCGGWSLEGMDLSNDALCDRVLNGLKPMCFIVEKTKEKIDSYIKKIDLNRFSYSYSIRYLNSIQEPYYDLLIAHKGKIGELFDLESLQDDYERSGVFINTEPYKYKCIEDLFPGWINNEINSSREFWLSGLLYGYPLENTISIYYEFYDNYNYFG